jgi:hypothetical protein
MKEDAGSVAATTYRGFTLLESTGRWSISPSVHAGSIASLMRAREIVDEYWTSVEPLLVRSVLHFASRVVR